MKTKPVTLFLLSVAAIASIARAQPVTVVTPAPMVPTAAPAAAPAPNQVIYAARLPGVNELTNAAAAQGIAIERIVQSPSQITATYRFANGQTNTVAYLLLPGSGAAYTQTATPPTPAPTVVYYDASPRAYYDGYGPTYYSDRGYWYPPISIGLGFGFRGGGFRGGFGHRR